MLQRYKLFLYNRQIIYEFSDCNPQINIEFGDFIPQIICEFRDLAYSIVCYTRGYSAFCGELFPTFFNPKRTNPAESYSLTVLQLKNGIQHPLYILYN